MFIFATLLLIAVGVAVHEGFRRFPKASWVFLVGAPLLLIIFETFYPLEMVYPLKGDWFPWLKTASVVIESCLILLVRYMSKKKVVFNIIYIWTLVNISEASLRMISGSHSLPHSLMAVSGVLLLILLPTPRYMSVVPKGFRDFEWDISYGYIFVYTLWDLIIIYLHSPEFVVGQFILLFSPLLVSLWNRKLYVQARVSSFAFFAILFFLFYSHSKEFFAVDWQRVQAGTNLAVLTFFVTGAYFAYVYIPWWKKRFKI